MTALRLRSLAAAAMLATLAACSGGGPRPGKLPPPPRAVVTISPAEIDAVLALLLDGKEHDAARQLDRLLKRDPMSAGARLLKDSIERDPTELLGPTSYPYVVRAADTPLSLAQRLLGNRLKVYQLLRYNGLKAPVTLAPGQQLRIPGEPPRIEPVRRSEPTAGMSPRPRPEAPRPVAAPAPSGNPAAARTVRAAGLTALNGGDVNRAVGLLRRAAALDPGNPLIARDLTRAERIAATVRARR